MTDFLLPYYGRLYESDQVEKAKNIEKLKGDLQHSHHSILYLNGAAGEIFNQKHSDDELCIIN